MKRMKYGMLGILLMVIFFTLPLFASDQRDFFLINDQCIQSKYEGTAILKFHIKDDEKQAVHLYRESNGEKMQEIENITWHKKGTDRYAQLEVVDGDQIQYTLTYGKKSWKTARFSKTETSSTMSFSIDGKTVKGLASTYDQDKNLCIRFADGFHYDDLQIIKDGKKLSITYNDNKELHLHLTNGRYRIRAGHYDKEILIDNQAPEVVMEGAIDPTIVYDQEAKIKIRVDDPNFDATRSIILVDHEKIAVDWKQQNNLYTTEIALCENGSHHLALNIIDLCGNDITKELMVQVDSLAPMVSYVVTGDANEIQPSYDHDIDLQFYVKDDFIDEKKSQFIVNGKQENLHSVEPGHYQYKFTQGSYVVQYVFYDLAGHKTEGELPGFIVDTEMPMIDLQVSEVGESFHNGVNLKAFIKDDFIKAYDFSCKKDGKDFVSKIDWETPSKDTRVSDIRFEQEGDYECIVTAEDAGGHTVHKSLQFYIDKTRPAVELKFTSGIMSTYMNTALKGEMIIHDQHLLAQEIEINCTRNQEKIKLNLVPEADGFHIPLSFSKDGDYELKWNIIDQAGNQVEDKRTFHIDLVSPVIVVDGIDKQLTNHDVRIHYTIQDDHLMSYECILKENGIEKDRTLSKNGRGSFLLEGLKGHVTNYEIIMNAKDKAGNSASWQSKPIVIDKQIPEISLLLNHHELQEGQPYVCNKDVMINIEMKDNDVQGIFYVWKDHKLIKEIRGEKMQVSLSVYKNEVHTYELEAIAIDKAGNRICKKAMIQIDNQIPELVFSNLSLGESTKKWRPRLIGEAKEFRVVAYTLQRNGIKIPYVWGTEINEEGDYALQVFVMDQAMNKKQFTDEFTFSIDQTAPIIQLYDADHQWFLEDKAPIHSHLYLYLDQPDKQKRKTERFKEIVLNDRKLSENEIYRDEQGIPFITISLDEIQHVKVSAIDAAGNISTLDKVLYPVAEHEVDQQIKESKAKHPILSSTLLPEKERADYYYFGITMIGLVSVGFGYAKYKRLSNRPFK